MFEFDLTLGPLHLHLAIGPDTGGEHGGDREGSADALVERADPYAPPIGFGPSYIREDRLTR